MAENQENKNSKARIDANNRYAAKTYDKVTIMMPKGTKEILAKYAKDNNESLNAYINRAITVQLKKEASEK